MGGAGQRHVKHRGPGPGTRTGIRSRNGPQQRHPSPAREVPERRRSPRQAADRPCARPYQAGAHHRPYGQSAGHGAPHSSRQKRTPTARLAICTTGTQITCFGATSGGRIDDAVADQADTCVPCIGPVATVRDGSRRAASVGRSRRSEHPGAEVSVAETLIGRACEQPGFAVSDVRFSRRTTVTPSSRLSCPEGAG